jgi:hypothetical protein
MAQDTSKAQEKPKIIEVVAPSVEAGIEAGARAMGVSSDRVGHEVLEETKAKLGIGSGKVKVRVHLKPPEPRVDGKFLVGYRNERFYLIVTPPSGRGRSIDAEQLGIALSGMPLPDGAEAVWHAELAKPTGEAILLSGGEAVGATRTVDAAELLKEESADSEAAEGDEAAEEGDGSESDGVPEYEGPSFTILVSEDQMRAWLLNSSLEFDTVLTREEVDADLVALGVTFGISEILLERALTRPLVVPWQIAQGVAPVNGVNGSIEYKFKTHLGLTDEEMEELNTVDWYELFAHDQIFSGETLVEACPATEGTVGHTVLGADLPQTPGEPVDLAALSGENTEIDGNFLKATVSGEPVLNGEKVEVAEVMEVPDDVDFSTGNIRFPGSVEVKGGVRPGFTIEVRDNLTVGGSVEGAHLAAAGDITIAAGFLGESDGREGALLAGGDVQVKYLQAGNVTTGGDLLVGEDIVRSNVGVLGKITVAGRGRIVGGRVSAGTAIHAKSIGAPTGVRTIVAVGNPGSEAKTVEALLEARVLSQMADDGGTPDLEEIEEADAAAAAEAGEDGEEGEEGEDARAPRLVVSGEIYEGTVVGIGSLALVVDRRIDHCTLRESEGRIQVFPL